MADIVHEFPVGASPAAVFAAVATPAGLDAWWTLQSSGEAEVGARWSLYFGETYDWRAEVTAAATNYAVEWEFTTADDDWVGTRVRIELHAVDGGTRVRFSHRGWREEHDHFRTSSYCWAMYLRLMARFVERGEVVAYAERLQA
jgi:uncharacterized protein YndB with AHSA1/START domain